MSDRKPIIIAVSVGTLALVANGAAAVIAVSAAAPPQAAIFGIVGLTAAFTGLITTIIWACRSDLQPQRPRGRVFTPWVAPEQDTEAYMLPEPRRQSALALAAPAMSAMSMPTLSEAPVTLPMPERSDSGVIYLQDWLKTHNRLPVNA